MDNISTFITVIRMDKAAGIAKAYLKLYDIIESIEGVGFTTWTEDPEIRKAHDDAKEIVDQFTGGPDANKGKDRPADLEDGNRGDEGRAGEDR